MITTDVVLTSACRTAIGGMGGALKDFLAKDLGAIVIAEAIRRAGIAPDQVQEVFMGNIFQAGQGQGPARQAALKAGIPIEAPATTVNILCGSGMKAIILAAQAIMLGDAEVTVAGGMESMTNAPYLLLKGRFGYRMGDDYIRDSMIYDGLRCAINDYHMGITAENLAEKYNISREEQDQFALESQRKAAAALASGRFRDEIVPVSIPQRKGDPVIFDTDEHPKPGTTLESLAKLKPAFKKDGTVTAGNASGINDGAAAMVLMSARKAEELGVKPIAYLRGYATAGVDPKIMGIGPVPATRAALKMAGLTLDQVDLIEANEAFAAQALAVGRELQWDPAKVNVNGGAIALGHPVGASGARIVVTLVHEMMKRRARYGLATLCVGGGMGVATVWELA